MTESNGLEKQIDRLAKHLKARLQALIDLYNDGKFVENPRQNNDRVFELWLPGKELHVLYEIYYAPDNLIHFELCVRDATYEVIVKVDHTLGSETIPYEGKSLMPGSPKAPRAFAVALDDMYVKCRAAQRQYKTTVQSALETNFPGGSYDF